MDVVDGGTTRHRTRRKVALGAAALVVVVAAVACRPLPIGSATAKFGNDVAGCAQLQPSPVGPCGPQPLLWSSIAGPYSEVADGDPYASKCEQGGEVSAEACSSGPYAGGATNILYDPTGYEFAVDVKPADVGRSLTLQVWDAGASPRSVGVTSTSSGTAATGSTTLEWVSGTGFSSADVGKRVTGTGIAGGTDVLDANPNRLVLSKPVTSSGSRTVTLTPDCNTALPPFNAAPYSGSVTRANCQTGDSGRAPFQAQLFDNDGLDLEIDYTTPLTGCELYVAPADAATYENTWTTVCTFTPTQTGIYPLRVKSSGITRPNGTVIADSGTGSNSFALRVQNATATRLHALRVMAYNANTPGSESRFYLTDVRPEDAGKILRLDVFDPGDGTAGDSSIQVLAPPSGAPNVVPSAGTPIPSTGWADACRHNPVSSPTGGPDVTFPSGQPANLCRVVTRTAGVNHYQGGWLRIEVEIADTYNCTTDCFWSVRLDGAGAGADHAVLLTSIVEVP